MASSSLSYFFLKKLIFSSRSGSFMRRITFLSFFGIFVSVASFLIILFVMNGMNKSIQNRIIALDPNVVAHFKNNHVIPLNEYAKAQTLQFDSYDLIMRTVDGQFRGAQAVGYKQDDFNFWINNLNSLRKNIKSDIYTEEMSHIVLDQNEIAIGIDLARSLGLLEGDQVTLIPIETLLNSETQTPIFEKVTIKKIFATDLADKDANLIFFNREKSLKSFLKSLSRNSGYHLWLSEGAPLNSILTDLKSKDFDRIETWKENNSELFFALFMEKTMIGLILALAGLIASSSILTVLALIMAQKRSDIAILKTLGLSDKKTHVLFAKIGLWISLVAVSAGILLGLGVSYWIQFYPLNILPQIYYDASIPAQVNLPFAVGVFLACCALAFVGCYFPARATLKIEPAILLKQKN